MKTEKEQIYLDRIAELEKMLMRTHHKIKKDTYGLHWLEVPEAFEDDVENKLPILKEIKEKAIVNDDGKPTHILIEGDNYHALTCLNYSHKGKIDVIYIDPPYNTGKDGFRYKDKRILTEFPDGTEVPDDHPLRHSYWLSFMKKRLELAKPLLTENGVIFISIDDNEFTQLKLLCDQIFGQENFISMLIHKNNSSKNQANLLSISIEYMLLYKAKKDGLKGKKWRIPKKGSRDIALLFNRLKKKGFTLEEIKESVREMYSRPKYAHLSRWNKVDEDGIFKDADLSREGGPKDYTIINPGTGKACAIPDRGWGKSYEELIRLQKENLIWYGDDKTPPGLKDYIDTDDKTVPDNFMYYDNSIDTRLIKSMFGNLVFENPKPAEMIKHIIRMASSKNSIILDFFAGSGTTSQAVLELNEEDGGNRQFILSTNNEENICIDVCKPRIDYLMNGYRSNTTDQFVEGLGNSLKYYLTEFIGEHNILGANDFDRIELAHHASEILAIAENTHYKLDDLQTDFYQFFKNVNQYTAVYFREELDHFEDFRQKVLSFEKPVAVYVFSWGEIEFSNQFEDRNEIEVKPIPQPILEVYNTIYNVIN